jgi:hypothetical protein
MTVREFIATLTPADMEKTIILASDDEENSYHALDPKNITEGRVENGMLVASQGHPNALILVPAHTAIPVDLSGL